MRRNQPNWKKPLAALHTSLQVPAIGAAVKLGIHIFAQQREDNEQYEKLKVQVEFDKKLLCVAAFTLCDTRSGRK